MNIGFCPRDNGKRAELRLCRWVGRGAFRKMGSTEGKLDMVIEVMNKVICMECRTGRKKGA